MENERLKILKMLEDGKINADEAAALLEAGRAGGPVGNDGRSTERPGHGFDDFTGELGRKFDAFARDFQPKLKMATEIVVEKTADLAERISRTMDAETTRGGSAGGTVVSFNRKVTEGGAKLIVGGLDGDVCLRGYNGDTVSLDVRVRPKRPSSFDEGDIQFKQIGREFKLCYDEYAFDSVAADVFLPSGMFDAVSAQTVNAKLAVSGITCENGRFDNFNGEISLADLDIKNMSATTSNSPVTINIGSFGVFREYVWAVETSNAPLSMSVPSPAGCGYHIRAHAALGDIKLGVAGMSFLYNDGSNVEAKSMNFDAKPVRVMLSLETSYASIDVK